MGKGSLLMCMYPPQEINYLSTKYNVVFISFSPGHNDHLIKRPLALGPKYENIMSLTTGSGLLGRLVELFTLVADLSLIISALSSIVTCVCEAPSSLDLSRRLGVVGLGS